MMQNNCFSGQTDVVVATGPSIGDMSNILLNILLEEDLSVPVSSWCAVSVVMFILCCCCCCCVTVVAVVVSAVVWAAAAVNSTF